MSSRNESGSRLAGIRSLLKDLDSAAQRKALMICYHAAPRDNEFLDLNNRPPFLELLRQEFPRHQIILLTHDLVWFEIAKEHTADWRIWCYARLFEEPLGPVDPTFPRAQRVKPDVDDLTVAQGYLVAGDLRATAVYVRAAYESCLRNICQKKSVCVPFKKNTKDVRAEDLWQAIKGFHESCIVSGGEFLDPALIPKIDSIRSAVLNRLSHSGASSLTSTELGLHSKRFLKSAILEFHSFHRQGRAEASEALSPARHTAVLNSEQMFPRKSRTRLPIQL